MNSTVQAIVSSLHRSCRTRVALAWALTLALILNLSACDRQQTASPPAAPDATAKAPPAAGPQPQPDAGGTNRAQTSGLPDFTVLVERQGPAVVNVVTTRRARPGAGVDLPDDPIFDFFRRFMPNPPTSQ